MIDYLKLTYKDKPFTRYPQQLIDYLIEKYNLKKDMEVLDFMCGRGEYVKAFHDRGFEVYGFDQSGYAKELFPYLNIYVEEYQYNKPLMFVENSFDVIFNKSVLEHFYYPEKLVSEMYKILREDGVIITMVPECSNLTGFYGAFTHRTPFTENSLKKCLELCGFVDVSVETIIIVPVLWKYPWLKLILQFLYIFPWLRKNTDIQFSRTKMLLAYGRKG